MNAMKKTLLALLIAIMSIGVADAKFRFGVKAGVNVNSLHFKDPSKIFDADNGTGWTAGIMTDFQLPLIGLGVDLSLMYTRMNADVEYDLNNLEDYYGARLSETGVIKNRNFIQIPLNLKYKISLPVVGKFIAPYVFTGPAFSFKLDKNTLDNIKTKTCQVAWNVGLGVELVKHLQVGASYGFGINNIADKWLNAENLNLKNNYWTITAAYLF